jgi:hypothetical protein
VWCSTVAESCNFFLKCCELGSGFNRSHHCSSIVRCRQWYGHLGFTVESIGFNSLIGVFCIFDLVESFDKSQISKERIE